MTLIYYLKMFLSGFSNSNATREIPLHWQETLWWSWKKKDSLRQSSGERKYNYIYVAYKTCNAGIPSLFCLFTFLCLLGQSSSTFVTDQAVDSKSSTLQLGIWEFYHKFISSGLLSMTLTVFLIQRRDEDLLISVALIKATCSNVCIIFCYLKIKICEIYFNVCISTY